MLWRRVGKDFTVLSGWNMLSPTEIDFKKKCQLNDGIRKGSSLFKFLICGVLEH